MKSSILIILLLAASVAAQSYDTVTIAPGTLDISVSSGDVYGTTWGQCAAVCTNQCLESKKGTREECDKICTDQCHPQPDVITKQIAPTRIIKPMPPITVDCMGACKQNLLQCEQGMFGGAADCRGAYGDCIKKCQPAQPTCEQMCKDLSAKTPESSQEVFMKCVQSRCNYRCETACGILYGDNAENCIAKLCRPNIQPPQTCEGRCEMMRDDCKASNVEPRDCQMKIDDCKRQCKPACPEIEGCPVKCTGMYYECRSGGRDNCEQSLVGCLESCRPGRIPPPVYRCEDKCVKIENDCIEAGNSKEACMPRTEECMKQCRPALPSGKCEDVCVKIKGECGKAGVDDESCRMKIDDCMKRCQPEEKEPSCPEKCSARADDCLKQGIDRQACVSDKAKCMRDCGQAEEPPMAAGEQREQGFFSRLWSSIVG